ncbi:MAG: CsgG/HfaB family protein, partial [Caulobacteraceae bacterium]
TGLGLSNPEALIKLMAQRSNCLRVVARGAALAIRQQERDLADSGELRRNNNVGKGQIVAADYTIIPDIVDSNGNAGGMNIGAAARAFGGPYGALLGGLSTKKSEAHALITLVNTRTTEQEYVAEGTAQKTDISLFGGGGGYNFSGAGGGYSNTDIGKVVTAAYINAFVDLISHMQQRMPGTASADAGVAAYNVTNPIVMRASAAPSAKQVRNFAPGDLVYPTGQKNGIWWEVDDETGNRGWVTSTGISPRGGGGGGGVTPRPRLPRRRPTAAAKLLIYLSLSRAGRNLPAGLSFSAHPRNATESDRWRRTTRKSKSSFGMRSTRSRPACSAWPAAHPATCSP